MHAARIIMLSCALGVCAPAVHDGFVILPAVAQSPASAWKIDRKPDPITGAGANAWVMATRVTDRPGRPRRAALQLICFKNDAVIRLQFAMEVGANRSASLSYRFDDKPGRQPKARFLADRSTIVIADKADVARFVSELATANELIVSVDSLIIGKSNAAFPVGGAPAAIAAAFAQCPLAGSKAGAR